MKCGSELPIYSLDFIPVSNTSNHRFHRMMTRPFFSRERISDFDIFVRHADATISKMKARFGENGNPSMDFQDIVSRFTLDSATEYVSDFTPFSSQPASSFIHHHILSSQSLNSSSMSIIKLTNL